MTVRIGVLGAARIVRSALLDPAAEAPGVEVAAIAARDPARAAEYARTHDIPRVLADYDAVLTDPDLDAVYVPTPAALHGHWTRRAIAAGKHVLCEKPFTANADEAADVARLADGGGLVVMEAFHSRYHPLWPRLRELLGSGALGAVRTASAEFTVPQADRDGIRWQAALGGGALMDLGVYPVTLLRYLFGEPEAVDATAHEVSGVDAVVQARLTFPGDVVGEVRSSMLGRKGEYVAELRVPATRGELRVHMPYHPHLQGTVTVTTAAGTTSQTPESRSTYAYQLEAFCAAVADGAPVATDAREAVRTMRVIDDVYRAAGLAPRRPA